MIPLGEQGENGRWRMVFRRMAGRSSTSALQIACPVIGRSAAPVRRSIGGGRRIGVDDARGRIEDGPVDWDANAKANEGARLGVVGGDRQNRDRKATAEENCSL
jgi:hypothetical protein